MSATAFYRGQQLGRNDLNIFLEASDGTPEDAAEIFFGIYDFTLRSEVPVGSETKIPIHPSRGEYYASLVIPLDANIGEYRVRWSFRKTIGGPIRQVVMGFSVIDKVTGDISSSFSQIERDLGRRLRILVRDNNPDRNYRWRPPAHEETVSQFNRVFGFIWEDDELKEYLERSLDMIIASPPRTPFQSIDSMVAIRPEWKTLLLTGAMSFALQALRINWVADEWGYSIGGTSLDLEKSSKYEAAQQIANEQFEKQLERAKATVNFIKGVQQPKFGLGIRSSFGPYAGRGVLSPRKFVGF